MACGGGGGLLLFFVFLAVPPCLTFKFQMKLLVLLCAGDSPVRGVFFIFSMFFHASDS